VHSGDNTVGRFDLAAGDYDADFVDVGDGRNPWALAESGGRVFVTNFVADSISVADGVSGALLGELEGVGLEAPTGIAAGAGVLVAVSSNFVGPGYGEGTIHALRATDVAPFLEPIGTIKASALAPIEVVFDAARGRFYVVNSGERRVDPQTGAFVPVSDGAVDIIDLAALDDGLQDEDLVSIPLPISPAEPLVGAPSAVVLAPDGRTAYLPSSTSPALFKIDLERLEVLRGADDPIRAYLGEGSQLTNMVFGPDGLAYVTAFNQDALYLFDSGCDASIFGPVELGTSPLLEGPLDVAYDAAGRRALVLMSVSNALTVVTDP
jgi:DNA-binding beta-propeller fold protein YncE